MIRFELRCESGHGFDGWFRSGDDFDRQQGLSLVSCPSCGSNAVEKALMRPALSGTRKSNAPAPVAAPVAGGLPPEKAAEMVAQIQAFTRELRRNSHDVGEKFAEEARRIHFGEAPERQIHGQATGAEVRALAEDGIAAIPLPVLPEDKH